MGSHLLLRQKTAENRALGNNSWLVGIKASFHAMFLESVNLLRALPV
jgi:hypothetical protein